MRSTILVTGAAGKTGQQLVRKLVERRARVRAMVYRPEQVDDLLALGASEAVAADFLDTPALKRAVEGVGAVYHICPNVHPYEVAIGQAVIAAAQQASVERFVFHSVLYPNISAMPHHWSKYEVEQRLEVSDLAVTILRPCAYMQNVLGQLPQVTTTGTLEVPYDAEAALSVVNLGDVSEAGAAVLTEDGHGGKAYDLCGPEPLSHHDMAEQLSAALGRPVKAVEIAPETWEERARNAGAREGAIDVLLKMFAWYDEHGFVGDSAALVALLGRPLTTFSQFARRARVLAP